MKWVELKNKKLKKDKKDKKVKVQRITQVKGNAFMVETVINETTRRFNKVDIGLDEFNDLRKLKYLM